MDWLRLLGRRSNSLVREPTAGIPVCSIPNYFMTCDRCGTWSYKFYKHSTINKDTVLCFECCFNFLLKSIQEDESLRHSLLEYAENTPQT